MTADLVGERLVTVLLTLAVPAVADLEDAAALVADAVATTALETRVGVEGHLPAPGATVVRSAWRQPWQVVAVSVDTLRLWDLTGDMVEVARRSGRPDPLHVQIGLLASPPGGLTMLPPAVPAHHLHSDPLQRRVDLGILNHHPASNPPLSRGPAGRKPGALNCSPPARERRPR